MDKKTEIVRVDPEAIDQGAIARAGMLIRQGALVAFPTETVYGLGADAANPDAAHRIYSAKGRPSDNPLIVHIARMEDLAGIVAEVPEAARRLADRFWPGPLTMIFRKNDKIPYETTGGLDTVAVRMPSDSIARALILAGGGYIAAPSANTSGRPSPTLASHVAEDLDGKIDMILDGGAACIGLESTIVDLTEEEPAILRPGYVTREMLESALGEEIVDPAPAAADCVQRPKAPGMKYRHYAPRARLTVVRGNMEDVIREIDSRCGRLEELGKKAGIIATEETRDSYRHGIAVSIGPRSDDDAIARHLYGVLRDFDGMGVDEIYSESFDAAGVGDAIMNRLLKAAGQRVLEV